MLEKIANVLGVDLYEEFTVKATSLGSALGHIPNEEIIYRFDSELMHKGYNDGWSEWYGWNERILYYLCIGNE